MKILISAYSCEPRAGSEPGAGWSIVRAASEIGECWVLTRNNNIPDIEAELQADPPANPVHVVGVDGSDLALRLKRKLGAVRPYYYLWQRRAARVAEALDRSIGPFDIVHHVTMSAFWMPIGVAHLGRPLVLGPLSGGTITPRDLRVHLGIRGRFEDVIRTANVKASARLRREMFGRARTVISQNEQMSRLVQRTAPDRGPRLMTHSHASDPVVGDIVARQRSATALFVGRLVTWKGPLLAIDAFRQVDVPNARFIIVGSGPAQHIIERRVRELGLEDRVTLVGSLPRDQVLRMMAEASCLLFPSFHDSAGFVVSESLSLGTPVVCLDHGGPGTLVGLWPNVPSVAVKPADPVRTASALAAAVSGLMRDPAPIPTNVLPPVRGLAEVLADAYAAQGETVQ